MGGLVLFSTIILVTLSSSYGEKKFTGLMDLSDRVFVEGFGFCGLICVAPNLHQHVNKTLYQCQNTMMDIRSETREKAQQSGKYYLGPEDYYNFAIKRQASSNSNLCRWTHNVLDGCAGQLVQNHCDHDGIKRETKRTMEAVKAYICSLDPPVMECALHPEVRKDVQLCLAPLQAQFRKYFNGSVRSREDQRKQFQRFYNGEIKTNNSESLYNAFKVLGTCVSTLIGHSSVSETSCSKVKELIDAEVDNVIAYFKKTDMLKCNFDPELWSQLEECGRTFSKAIEDRAATRDTSVRYDYVSHLVEQFKHFAKDNYQLVKDPLKAFTTCALGSFKDVCQEKWTYNVAYKQLTLLENLFNPKDKTVPEHCEAVIQKQTQPQGGSAATSKTVVVLHVAVAVLLRVLILS